MHGGIMNFIMRTIVIVVLLCGGMAAAENTPPSKPEKSDKCPVCGMFVAKYPDFLAHIIFKDGTKAFFDGAKDMFKYFFNLKKYQPSRQQSDIAAVYVTDYYSMKPTDGQKASYVVGSDVYGPMGNELIPFENEAEAKSFLIDHAGKKLMRFDAVTPDVINSLE